MRIQLSVRERLAERPDRLEPTRELQGHLARNALILASG